MASFNVTEAITELFTGRKKALRQKVEALKAKAPWQFAEFIYTDDPVEKLLSEFDAEAAEAQLEGRNRLDVAQLACVQALSRALEDDYLDHSEEARLVELCNAFDMLDRPARETTFREALVKSAILRDVGETGHADRVVHTEDVDFQLDKGESLFWAESHAVYYEVDADKSEAARKVRKRAIGRIGRGEYLRFDAARGEKLPYKQIREVDEGWLALTSDGLRFVGLAKSFMISEGDIEAVLVFENGIVLDGAAFDLRPMIFGVSDPWFLANLSSKL